ncbi:MAG TPA: hypothetical protein VFU33_13680 [Gaiellaceae bacterium]|nr:hypothetical protein [Gaiellaceae bacterium]
MSSTGSPQTRAPRIGAAVSVRRSANDEIARVGSTLDDLDEGHRFEFLCECGDLSCTEFVRLTVEEYQALAPGFVLGQPVSEEIRGPTVSQRPMPDAATLAAANEHILLHVRDSDDGEQEWEFLCECGTEGCHERVLLTIDAYIALRDCGEAVLAEGHRPSQVERARRLREDAEAVRRQASHQANRAKNNLRISSELQVSRD